MTDICDELRASINKVWPKATLLQRSTIMRKSMEFPKTTKFLELCFMQMILSHMKKHTKI